MGKAVSSIPGEGGAARRGYRPSPEDSHMPRSHTPYVIGLQFLSEVRVGGFEDVRSERLARDAAAGNYRMRERVLNA